MSIFISIASYQDPLLVSTIFSAYNNATNKDELIFSICDQSDNPVNIEDLTFEKQVRYEHVDPVFSKGPCWARHRAQSFYQGEDYFLQIDSHTQFLPNWDVLFELFCPETSCDVVLNILFICASFICKCVLSPRIITFTITA